MNRFGENITKSLGIEKSIKSTIRSVMLSNLGIEFENGVYFTSNSLMDEIGERIIKYLNLKDSLYDATNKSITSDNENAIYFAKNSLSDLIRLRLIKFLKLEELINQILDEPVVVPIVLTRENVKPPEYAKPEDAGMDVRSAEGPIYLKPGEKLLIKTGIKVALPNNFEFEVVPRSGLSLNLEFEISNSPGTIDPKFDREVRIIVKNGSTIDGGPYTLDTKGNPQGTYIIEFGDRIAQIKLKRFSKCKWMPTTEEEYQNKIKGRGDGFGGTGVK